MARLGVGFVFCTECAGLSLSWSRGSSRLSCNPNGPIQSAEPHASRGVPVLTDLPCQHYGEPKVGLGSCDPSLVSRPRTCMQKYRRSLEYTISWVASRAGIISLGSPCIRHDHCRVGGFPSVGVISTVRRAVPPRKNYRIFFSNADEYVRFCNGL